MAHSNGIITAPVSFGDVNATIGTAHTDLASLCKDNNINKWAKYKSVRYARIGIMGSSDWIAANYGITDIPTWTRLSYMSIFLFSTERGSLSSVYWPECDISKGVLSIDYFAWNKPVGGTNSPYRLSDFNGYFHNAEAPIGDIVQTSIYIDATGNLRVRFTKGAESDYTLKLSDLTWPGSSSISVGNMYFGVLMKQTSGSITSRTYVGTQKNGDTDIKMSEAGSYGYWVDFPSTIVDAAFSGIWKIYPIISSIPIEPTTSISTQDGNKYIAVNPFHDQSVSISIKYAEIEITSHFGYKDILSQGRYARFVFELRNNEDTGMYRNYSITVTLCDANGNQLSGYSGGTGTGQIQTGTNSSITVSAYIAQIYSSQIYYRAELTITDSLKFKRNTLVGLTGPITEDSPTPV